jgi:hypothetical protein
MMDAILTLCAFGVCVTAVALRLGGFALQCWFPYDDNRNTDNRQVA